MPNPRKGARSQINDFSFHSNNRKIKANSSQSKQYKENYKGQTENQMNRKQKSNNENE